MADMKDPVRVSERFFAIACKSLVNAGQLRRVQTGQWEHDYVSTATGQVAARFFDMVNDGVLCTVERSVFQNIVVQGNHYRDLNSTEYEMLCRKIEAHNRQDRAALDSIHLPSWTSGLFDQAVKDGLKSFRGRTARIPIPFTLSFMQASGGGGAHRQTEPAQSAASQARERQRG